MKVSKQTHLYVVTHYHPNDHPLDETEVGAYFEFYRAIEAAAKHFSEAPHVLDVVFEGGSMILNKGDTHYGWIVTELTIEQARRECRLPTIRMVKWVNDSDGVETIEIERVCINEVIKDWPLGGSR